MKKHLSTRVVSLALACFVCAFLFPVPASSTELLQITAFDCSAESHPPVGEPITWTIETSGGTGAVEYGFGVCWGTDIYDDTYMGSEIVGLQLYGSSRSYTYTPDREGIYFVRGQARDAAGTVRTYIMQLAVFPPVRVLSIGTVNTHGTVGETVHWTARSQGGTGYEIRYQFIIYKDDVFAAAGDDITVPYDTSEFAFNFVPEEPGSYAAVIWVNAHTELDSLRSAPILIDYPLEAVSLLPDKWRTNPGGTVTWTAAISGGRDVLYRFILYRDGELIEYHNYGESNTFSARLNERGAYSAICHIEDHLGRVSMVSEDVYVGDYVRLPLGILGVFVNKEQAGPGTEITWNVYSAGGSGDRTYSFELYRGEDFVYSLSGVPENSFSYTLEETGTYRVRVRVSDGTGSAEGEGGEVEIRQELLGFYVENDTYRWQRTTPSPVPFSNQDDGSFTVTPSIQTPTPTPRPQAPTPTPTPRLRTPAPPTKTPVPLAVGISASAYAASVGIPVKATATGKGGTGDYQYSFLLYKDGAAFGTSTVYGPGSTYGFTSKQPGVYKIRVIVKDGENMASNFTGNITVK